MSPSKTLDTAGDVRKPNDVGKSDGMSRVVKAVWIAGVVAVIALVVSAGAGSVRSAIETVGWGVLGAVLFRGMAVAAAGAAWFTIFPVALRPPATTCILIRFVREGANALLPVTQAGGEVIGARVLTLCGPPASLSAASVIVDVLLQAATQFLFAALGVALLAGTSGARSVEMAVVPVIAVAFPALGGFYFVQRPAGQRLLKALGARLVGDRKWLSFGAIEALFARLDAIYANRAGLLAAAAIHMTGWLIGALEVWLILVLMGFPASYREAVIIESLMHAIRGAAFAVPAGLGAQEAGLIAICALFGVPPDAAVAMSLIKRVPDLVFGAPGLIGWQMLEGRGHLRPATPPKASRKALFSPPLPTAATVEAPGFARNSLSETSLKTRWGGNHRHRERSEAIQR